MNIVYIHNFYYNDKNTKKKIEQCYAFLTSTGWSLCFAFSIHFIVALIMLKVKHYILPKTWYSVLQGFAPYNRIPLYFPRLILLVLSFLLTVLLYLCTGTQIFINIMRAAILEVQITKKPHVSGPELTVSLQYISKSVSN